MCHTGSPLGMDAAVDVAQIEKVVPVEGGEQLPTLVCRPEVDTGAAVVIVGDVYGRSPFYEQMARQLAAAGFLAAVPELFFREGPLPDGAPYEVARERWGRCDERRALRDLDATVDFVRGATTPADRRTGIVGFCLGGTLALNMAARRRDLAAVCYYGFPTGSTDARHPAPPPLDEVAELSGPVLGLWGEDDPSVGMDNVRRYAEALRAHGVDFEHTIYPGVGHGFMAASERLGGHALETARDAWGRTLAFLRREVAGD
jgi:dienelactone hydrolase